MAIDRGNVSSFDSPDEFSSYTFLIASNRSLEVAVLTSKSTAAKQTPEAPIAEVLAPDEAAAVLSAAERRGAPRHPIKQRCIISLAGSEGPVSGWHCIAYNISATGIGVLLPLPVRPGIVLQIEPWGLPGAPTLLARVVHTKPFEFVWMCGCELSTPLHTKELQAWLQRVPT